MKAPFLDQVKDLTEQFWHSDSPTADSFLSSDKETKEKMAHRQKMTENLKQAALIFLMILFVGGGLGLAFLKAGRDRVDITKTNPSAVPATAESSPSAAETVQIKVNLAGAVLKPGVYEIAEGSRIDDLIEQAGGFTDLADRTWVEKELNLAQKLNDEDKLYIPRRGENASAGRVAGVSTSSAGGTVSKTAAKVNLNKATNAQLETLPGIGPAFSARIIDYRQKNGGFKRIEDLQKVSGIGPKTFLKLKDLVTVD